jgi:hypothetical protein
MAWANFGSARSSAWALAANRASVIAAAKEKLALLQNSWVQNTGSSSLWLHLVNPSRPSMDQGDFQMQFPA